MPDSEETAREWEAYELLEALSQKHSWLAILVYSLCHS
jgi:hypothetical protein